MADGFDDAIGFAQAPTAQASDEQQVTIVDAFYVAAGVRHDADAMRRMIDDRSVHAPVFATKAAETVSTLRHPCVRVRRDDARRMLALRMQDRGAD